MVLYVISCAICFLLGSGLRVIAKGEEKFMGAWTIFILADFLLASSIVGAVLGIHEALH